MDTPDEELINRLSAELIDALDIDYDVSFEHLGTRDFAQCALRAAQQYRSRRVIKDERASAPIEEFALPELAAMNACGKALEGLSNLAEKRRVIVWLDAKYPKALFTL